MDTRSRLNRTRKEERDYSKLICSFMRSLDEQQKKHEAVEKRERALSEADTSRRQLEADLIAGADGMGLAHESADSIQELESNASNCDLIRKIQCDTKARERYRQAVAKLNRQKMNEFNLKNSKRTQLTTPKFSQESTFNAIAKVVEAKKQQKRDLESYKARTHTDSAVKKYTVSYINVYSAANKYKVEKNRKDDHGEFHIHIYQINYMYIVKPVLLAENVQQIS